MSWRRSVRMSSRRLLWIQEKLRSTTQRRDPRVTLRDLAPIVVPPTLVRGDRLLRLALSVLRDANSRADAEMAWAGLSNAFDEVGA